MVKMCVYLAVIGMVAVARAQIPNFGFCPDYLPMANFDMNRFLGKWYEAERYFTFTDVVSRCVVTDYAKANSGRIYISNEVTNRLTGVKRVINGNLQLVGKGDEGKLNVKYQTTPIPTETTLMVLESDYDNYAVVWSCSGFGPIHAQNAWLMTRDRLPSGAILQKAYGILDKFKISRTFFVKTDQEGCALAASDINAANGITTTSTVAEATGSEQRKVAVKNEQPAVVSDVQKDIKLESVIKKVTLDELVENAMKVALDKKDQQVEKIANNEETKSVVKLDAIENVAGITDIKVTESNSNDNFKKVINNQELQLDSDKQDIKTSTTNVVSLPEHILKHTTEDDTKKDVNNLVKS